MTFFQGQMAFTRCILFTHFTREQNTTCKAHLAFQKVIYSRESAIHSFSYPNIHSFYYECRKGTLSNFPLNNQHPLFFKRFQVCVCNLIIPKNPMTLGLYYYFPYPSLNRIEVVVVSSLLHYTHIYIHLSSLVMYLKRGANQRLSSLLRLLLRLLPQNFYMAPYLERGQEESSPIGINGHSTLERKATKPFSKSTFWPYVCVCA